MIALLQRVLEASVTVEGAVVGAIGRGLLIFLGVERGDGDPQADALARKIAGLRLFEDPAGKMNLSNEDIGGDYLVVSQFTLCADLSRGKRPGFDRALPPPESERLYRRFCERLAADTGRPVRTGTFGASMIVSLKNEGPATFLVRVPPDQTRAGDAG
ncbi:MAG TPA: D-aminoacyl-tRNA deacylase [Planctomycetota bacterium]|jgi:D-tyrosyl-tRNA(Tyr) deacylase|nr:D-aminoacyl-tRNA deacylase [Planctomycetota bacterium]